MKIKKIIIMKRICLSLFLLFYLGILNIIRAQGENLFKDDIVHEVYITFEDNNFWSTLISNYDDNYPNVPYVMANATIDGETVDSIGVRLKGYSSYWVETDKKSIKLDFNEFVPGKKYDGLKKVNLNNGEGDPAIQRDRLCYDILRASGVKAPRTSYAKVYLNGDYWGLYLLVEQVDKTFIKRNFINDGGNLFKNMADSELDWLGSTPSSYQDVFELKTGNQPNAWTRFVNLMDVINNTPDDEFKDAISEVFNVDLYLKVLAVDVATNNWDSYIEHGRNFYLYEDTVTQQFQWIPWDYNLAIGGQFSSGGGGGGGPGGSGPGDPAECATIVNGSCPYPPEDTIFIQVINQDAFCCNNDWDAVCQNLYDNIASGNNGGSGNGGGGSNASFPVDMSGSQKVLIKRLLAVPEFRQQYYKYWCALLDNNITTERLFPMIETNGDLIRDFIYADPNYMWTTQNFEEDLDQGNNYIPGLKKFFQTRTPVLSNELENLVDCNDFTSDLNVGDVVINEFMASNDSLSGISDSAGQFDDWIELYNNTSATIDLSNAYLTDDKNQPQKWAFPAGTSISPDSYLIVWADEDGNQTGLHANFKLSKLGEFIMLSNNNSVLDSITFGTQITNLTASRVPNGTGDFIIQNPTFNANNEGTTPTNELNIDAQQIRIYPNPANDFIQIEFEISPEQGTIISLYNNIGQKAIHHQVSEVETSLPVNYLSPGIYFLTIQNPNGKMFFSTKVSILK